jgi:hypothetical protein
MKFVDKLNKSWNSLSEFSLTTTYVTVSFLSRMSMKPYRNCGPHKEIRVLKMLK